MPRAEFPSLGQHLAASGAAPGVMLQSARASVVLSAIARGPSGRARALAGKSVLVLARDQLTSSVALRDLDGVVSRLVLCPPDFTKERLAPAIEQAEVEAIVGDDLVQELGINALAPFHDWRAPAEESDGESISYGATEWVLPTSGTTGAPKGVVHVHAGFPLKAAQELAYCFDLHAGDRRFWISDIGWMMGPWAITGGLRLGATCVLYEGSIAHPAPDRVWAMVERHAITHLGISPTAVRGLMGHGDEWVRAHDLQSLLILAGKRDDAAA